MQRAFAGLVAIIATLLLAEGAIRVVKPTPRVQVVRPGAQAEMTMEVIDGVPIWYHENDTARFNWDCLDQRADAPSVLFLGDSIFAGVSVPGERVWTRRMEEQWPDSPAPCMINLAQPGYSFQNELKVAQAAVERFQPDLVVVEYWLGSLWDYTVLDGTAYRFAGVEVDSRGVPNPWLNLPALNAWLFPRSRLYEYATMAIAIPLLTAYDGQRIVRQSQAYMNAFEALAEAQGAEMMVVYPSTLKEPFELHRDRRQGSWEEQPGHPAAAAATWAEERDIEVVFWDEEMAARNVDYLEVRLDPCCHYNERGQQDLADVMLPYIRDTLKPPPPPSPE